MEVGEYHLTFASPTQFLGLRLLDLDDHVGLGVDLVDGIDEGCPSLDVVHVGHAGAAVSMSTVCPASTKSRAPTGNMPTRSSSALISLGTPMIMILRLLCWAASCVALVLRIKQLLLLPPDPFANWLGRCCRSNLALTDVPSPHRNFTDQDPMPGLPNGGDPLTDDFLSGPGVGDPIPDFELPDAYGRLVRFADRPPRTRR